MIDLDAARSIPEAFLNYARKEPLRIVYRYPIRPDGEANSEKLIWQPVTAKEMLRRALKTANFLASLGFKKGDRAAIISVTRREWLEADMGVLFAGGTVVSIYHSLPEVQIAYILFDTEAKVVFAENEEQVEKLLAIVNQRFYNFSANESTKEIKADIALKRIIAFEPAFNHPLVSQFDEVLEVKEFPVPEVTASLCREDLASIVYTSGSTGPPKGVLQTHGNHLANIRQVYNSGMVGSDVSLLLFLPLAHSFGKLLGYVGLLTTLSLKFVSIADSKKSNIDANVIAEDMRRARADIIAFVPRLLEKIKLNIEDRAHEPTLSGLALRATLWASRFFESSRSRGVGSRFLAGTVGASCWPLRRILRAKVFGANLDFGVCGGAPLAEEVARFFWRLGIEIYEGYGLTETCVAVTANRPGLCKIGTVGTVLDSDIEIQVQPDQEICIRGPNVSLGYLNHALATQESWKGGGWFFTGDLGTVDEEGFLRLIGRKKEIIITSHGKNISPQTIEDKLRSVSRYISEACVIGDKRNYCVALVSPNKKALAEWAARTGIELEQRLSEDKRVFSLLSEEIAKLDSELASYETIKRFAVLDEGFTVENGLLTPTFKLRRQAIEARFRELIEALYSDHFA